jgi:type I restriction enzyme S subunit
MSKLLEQINRQEYKLGSLLEVTSSKRIYLSEYKKEGVPFFRSKEIIEFSKGRDISLELFISKERYDDIKDKFGVPQIGDILLTSVGSIGVPFLVKNSKPFYFKDGNLTWFKNYNGIDSQYLFYWIISDKGQSKIEASSIGSSQSALTIDSIKKLEINIPDVTTQKKIASILGFYDAKIENNNKIIKNLELTAQTIFNEWFVNFKFHGYKKVKMVDSEVGEIPDGWTIKKISDISKLNKGVSYTSNEINTEKKGVALINLGSFRRGGGFNLSGTKYYTGDFKENHVVKPGQILIAMTDLTSNREVIGHPARLPVNFNEAVISLDVCSLVPTKDIYNEFIYSLMLKRDFSKLMASCASGTNVSHLSRTHIEGYEFVLPEEKLLVLFNDFIQPLFNKQALIEDENQRLLQTRNRLLAKLI